MKKILKRMLLLFVVMLLIMGVLFFLASTLETQPKRTRSTATFYGGRAKVTCELTWGQMNVKSGDEGTVASLILNRNHAPDTVGDVLRDCIEGGWKGYR